MKTDELEKRITNQIEYAQNIINLLDAEGHVIDINEIDLLDEIATLGLELVPAKDVNVASLAYISLLSESSIKELIKRFRAEQ